MTRTVELGDVCAITMGQAPVGESYNDRGDGVPLIAGAGDFGSGVPAAKKFTTAASKLCKRGDIVLSIRASIGDRILSDGVYALGRGVAGLRPKDGLDRRYLWNWLGFASRRLAAKGRGATFLQVNRADIAEMPLPLPPIDEQQRIADILDRADTLRAKRREALALLDDLTQSIFFEMFGDPAVERTPWPVQTVGDLLESAQYGTSAKAGVVGKFPILRMGNLTTNGRVTLTDLKYIDLPPRDEAKYTVREGDVLFNRTNSAELVGKTAVFREHKSMAFAGYLVRLRVREPHQPEYVSAFLNGRYGKAVLRGMAKSIVGMANINAKEVQSIRLCTAGSAPNRIRRTREAGGDSSRAASVEPRRVG